MSQHQEAPVTKIEEAVFDFTQATMGHANLRSHLVNALHEQEQMDDGEVEELVRAVAAAYRKYNG